MKNFIYFIIFFTPSLALYKTTYPMLQEENKSLIHRKKNYRQKKTSPVLFNNQIISLNKSKKPSSQPKSKNSLFPNFKANKGFHTYGGTYLSQSEDKPKPKLKKRKKLKKKIVTFRNMKEKTLLRKLEKEIQQLETIVKVQERKSQSFSTYEFIKRKPLYLSESSWKNLKCGLLKEERRKKSKNKILTSYFRSKRRQNKYKKKSPLGYNSNKHLIVGENFIKFK